MRERASTAGSFDPAEATSGAVSPNLPPVAVAFLPLAVVILTIHRNPLLAEPSVLCDNPNRVHLVKDDIRSAKDLQEGIEAAIQGTKFSLVNTATALVITKDQADVLRLMARGMSNKEIARVRETTLGAVENITQRIYSNLRLTGDDSINPRAKAIAMYQNSQVTVA